MNFKMMKMNYLYYFLFFLLVSAGSLHAQQEIEYKEKYHTPNVQNFEQFIADAYGDRAEELVFNNEIKRLILKDYFEKRIEIIDRNPEIENPPSHENLNNLGGMGYVSTPSLEDFDPENFNPFYYNIDFLNTKEIQFFHISNNRFYIQIKPFDPEVINQLRQEY